MISQKSPFFIVYDSFVSELGLSGLELLVYSLIFSFGTQGHGLFNGGINHIVKRTGASRSGVRKALNHLIKRGLITKTSARLKNMPAIYVPADRGIPILSVTDADIQSDRGEALSDSNKKQIEKAYTDMSRSELLGITDLEERRRCAMESAYIFSEEDIDNYSAQYYSLATLLAEMVARPKGKYCGKITYADTLWKDFILNLREDHLGLSIRDFLFAVMNHIGNMKTGDIVDTDNYIKSVIWSMLKKYSKEEL